MRMFLFMLFMMGYMLADDVNVFGWIMNGTTVTQNFLEKLFLSFAAATFISIQDLFARHTIAAIKGKKAKDIEIL